jgi:deoxyribose-phosphate aldolase
MRLSVQALARLMDLSAVRADVDETELRALVAEAARRRCVCVFPMPCWVPLAVASLADCPEVGVGGVVGFPSGATTTASKVAEARELLAAGVRELDMVINVGWLRSGHDQAVLDDLRAVVAAAGDVPVKVILEVHWLTDDQIRSGSELAVRAGAAFVKTATGWTPTGATPHNVALIKAAVGDAAQVKAAGGVRDLATVVELYRCGARRFGVSHVAGARILDECAALPGGAVEVHAPVN